MNISALRTLVGFGLILCACVAARETGRPGENSTAPGEQTPMTNKGVVVAGTGGERLTYCARPLTLWIKVDSLTAPSTQLVAGTAELRGDEGTGRHPAADEVIYVRSGWGRIISPGDTAYLGPGSIVYVPPGTPHHLVSSGPAALEYFWVMGPRASAAGFRRAAAAGCDEPAAVPPPPAQESNGRILTLAPGEGERLTYCPFPLTITFKIDAESVSTTRLVAATGALRHGSEIGMHSVDEVVLITHGQGYAFIERDTVAVKAGAVVFTPGGARHGLINAGRGTLEYLVVYGPWPSPRTRAGFRNLAAQPGPFCPDGSD